MADYYKILGVERTASQKEIKEAYRLLARKLHPDVNHGDKRAEQRFKEVNQAYEVLGDSAHRKDYDEFGDQWRNAQKLRDFGARRHSGGFGGAEFGDGLFGGIGDLFGFGSSRRQGPSTVEAEASISFQEAYRGTKRRFSVGLPTGTRTIDVAIPAGISNNGRVAVRLGEADLKVKVRVMPNAKFQRKGADLHTRVAVPLKLALLGGEVIVETPSGRVALKIPPDTQNGKAFKMRGKGMPKLGSDSFGDLVAEVAVDLPVPLSDKQRATIKNAL